MAFEVHFLDRRTGARVRAVEDRDWREGDEYWWARGNGDSDNNRSLLMYPNDKVMQIPTQCSETHVIVVEKIVVDKQVVYQESPLVLNNHLADQLDARLWAACAVLESADDEPWHDSLLRCRLAHQLLAEHPGQEAPLQLLDEAIRNMELLEGDCDNWRVDPEDCLLAIERTGEQFESLITGRPVRSRRVTQTA